MSQVKFVFTDGASTVQESDAAADMQARLTACLYEFRRLVGRYGATAFTTAAAAAATAYDLDANNGSPKDSATVLGYFAHE